MRRGWLAVPSQAAPSRVSADLNALDAYVTGCPFCNSAAPNPCCKASPCRVTSGRWCAELCAISCQQGGLVSSARFGRNLLKYWTMPNNCCTLALSVGAGISMIACTWAGPLAVVTCPMYGISVSHRQSFCSLSTTPRSSQHRRNALRFLSWSATAATCVSPYPTMIRLWAMT